MPSRLALLLSLLFVSACATLSPLDRLADDIERAKPYQYGYRPMQTDTLPDTKQRLSRIAFLMGIRIIVVPPDQMGENSGTYTYRERVIRIDASLPPDGQVQVVAHELAHALQPVGIEDPDQEVVADAIAYLVTREESDQRLVFAHYLARYQREARAILQAYEAHILWAAAVLRMELPR